MENCERFYEDFKIQGRQKDVELYKRIVLAAQRYAGGNEIVIPISKEHEQNKDKSVLEKDARAQNEHSAENDIGVENEDRVKNNLTAENENSVKKDTRVENNFNGGSTKKINSDWER